MQTLEKLAIVAIYAPLLGFLLNVLFLKVRSYAIGCTIIGMCIATTATLLLLIKSNAQASFVVPFFDWITVDTLKVSLGLKIDSVVLIMLGVVNTISCLVHIYSLGYMEHDPSKPRFMGYLSFFTFMMLLLVSAPNMAQLFLGWEGVGLASYLLIGFWSEKPSTGKAAMKAFVVNRVGDVGLILAMAMLLLACGSLDFDTVHALFPTLKLPSYTFFGCTLSTPEVIAFLLLLGAMGKSAQFGLHIWLPDAMQGPTPVSALIHAATMVTAGIFLIIRFSYIFEMTVYAKEFMIWLGVLTAVFGGTVALVQTDIKRVIAYSTCSQLGYMMAACGAGAYNAAFFHLGTHAFFKALLFLGAGSVIHAMSDEQDMKKMGGIYKSIPFTYALMWVGTLALIGMPFFSGYYSKDAILLALYTSHHYAAFALAILVVGMTSFYSLRVLYLTFHGEPKADEYVMAHVHESPFVMLAPLFVLAIGAVFSGYLCEDMFLVPHHFDWKNAIVLPLVPKEHILFIVDYLPIVLCLVGAIICYFTYCIKKTNKGGSFSRLMRFLQNKWYIDEAYERLICQPVQRFSRFLWRVLDQFIIDGFGPNILTRVALLVSKKNHVIQTGYVYHYAFVMIAGLLALSLFIYISLFGGN